MKGRAEALSEHVKRLEACRRCPGMQSQPVTGGAVVSRVILIGQAPGDKEPRIGRPFAWTAGRTLFRWFEEGCGLSEEMFRRTVYMAAVCRCFPGKRLGGGDRVPSPEEIATCGYWLGEELRILQPDLLIPVGKLAITRVLGHKPLVETVGRIFRVDAGGRELDVIPLPHPSGASPWHRIEPGKTLVRQALRLIGQHPAMSEEAMIG
ncbi:MAG: uracil-DNA glycosylase family protein [Candidatus Methylacidiphilales bacterium]